LTTVAAAPAPASGKERSRARARPALWPVLVAGGANVDRVARCLGPVAMASSNPAVLTESFGGVARNVAENLVRLGLPVELLTAVGDDVQGAALLRQAKALGIGTRACLVVKGAATGTYTALLNPDGELVVAMADMAVLEALTPAALPRGPRWASARTRVADLNLPPRLLAALLEDARRQGAAVVVVAVSEPKMERLPASLEGVSTLILNAGELATRVGRRLDRPGALAAACLEVLDQGAAGVVVTLGSAGVVCCDGARAPRHLPAPRARVVDVTGAGDAFAAGVVAGLDRDPTDLVRACRLGQRLAALTLGCRASVAPTLTPAFLRGRGSRRAAGR
jgi:pseudouridine kinase